MKKVLLVLSMLAVCGFIVGACGSDDKKPHCEDPPATCDPACTAPEFCCGTTCQEMKTCDPECAEGQYCDPCAGNCVDLPKTCDPACETGFYCDDGTCKEIPVCDPVCVAPQICVE